tara:strand:- start:703 stop:1329 length:627 start_codon:yes stop_codon:yes gene_type:complete
MKATQRYKGRTLNQAQLVKNILEVYNNQAHTGESNWYYTANELAISLATKYNVTTLQASGVIAALSPLKSWDENKRIAEGYLKNGEASHTGAMITKADDIVGYNGTMTEEFILVTLNGNKIQNFFLNIAFPGVALGVTIDRHAVSVAVGEVLPDSMLRSITDKQYAFFEDAYRIAANKVGILPHEIQAVVWVKWRKLKEAKKYAEVPF